MKNKIVVKLALIFCVLAFWGIFLAGPSQASPVVTDLVFEGDFQFDLNGMYYVYGIGYPLNVLGHLEVFDSGSNEKLMNLSLNGQKNFPDGGWDGTYSGHWAFEPVECSCDYEIGILPDLSRNEEDMLGFTLTGFNEILGIEEELPKIVAPLDGDHFEGNPVPIPTTLLLFGSGFVGLIGLKKRRLKAVSQVLQTHITSKTWTKG